jgi:Glu-tRNA(Gln) amidotransferase subunit E-like FAD-binding protein
VRDLPEQINYKKLKLKCGLEIHQQLDTKHKLFCNCSTAMQEREPITIVKRKQHPMASELGEIDVAAQYEYLRDRTFNYQVFPNEVCLVCLDEEPPHEVNKEALDIALQIALLLNCQIPNEIHVMRKTVIDGSNTSGFQRTMVVGLNGFLKYKGKKIEITHVNLEEDAAAIVKEENGNVTYRLNRLGVPLIEVGTGLLIGYTPEDIQDIAFTIGLIFRSTSKVKHGLGTVRQDVNVSIKDGERVEIKGVQDLGILAKVIKLEVERQLSLPKVVKETRSANEDGTTNFTRPLPGAARMYPETDIKPVFIDKKYVDGIRKTLPEPWTKKLSRFKSKLRLPDQLAKQILRSDYLELFEKIAETKKVEPTIVANTFTSLLKDLERRENVKIENLAEKHFLELFDYLAKKKIVKEAVPDILKYLASKPQETVADAIGELGLKPISLEELKNIINDVTAQPGITFDKAVGLVMSKVRGRVDAQMVIKTLKRLRRI